MSDDLHLREQDFGAQVKDPGTWKTARKLKGRIGVTVKYEEMEWKHSYIVTFIVAPQLLLIPCALWDGSHKNFI